MWRRGASWLVRSTWVPFLEGPETMFSHPKSRRKIVNVLTTELFYSYILNMNRGSLHTRSCRHIHLSVFKYRLTKNGFSGPKGFRGPWIERSGLQT